MLLAGYTYLHTLYVEIYIFFQELVASFKGDFSAVQVGKTRVLYR